MPYTDPLSTRGGFHRVMEAIHESDRTETSFGSSLLVSGQSMERRQPHVNLNAPGGSDTGWHRIPLDTEQRSDRHRSIIVEFKVFSLLCVPR